MERVSVRQLAIRLGTDARIVRGVAIGLGIRAEKTRSANLFTASQAERITRRIKEQHAVTAS